MSASVRRASFLGVAEDPRKRVWRQGGAPQGRLCAVLRLRKDAPPSYREQIVKSREQLVKSKGRRAVRGANWAALRVSDINNE
jgi:hypothetical protein